MFEWKWIRFEHVTWIAMVCVVMVGLAGGFGRGPMVRAQAGSSPIHVEYERVIRYQTPTTITIQSNDATSIERLFVRRALLDRLQLQSVVPQPTGAEPGTDGAVLLCPPTRSVFERSGTITVIRRDDRD